MKYKYRVSVLKVNNSTREILTKSFHAVSPLIQHDIEIGKTKFTRTVIHFEFTQLNFTQWMCR